MRARAHTHTHTHARAYIYVYYNIITILDITIIIYAADRMINCDE